MKKHRIVVDYTEEEYQRIQGFKARNGYYKTTEMIRDLIRRGMDDVEPSYVRAQTLRKRLTPAEKAHFKVDSEKEEVLARQKEGEEICKQLNGTIKEDGDGRFVCEYEMYELIGERVVASSMKESVTMLDRDTPRRQYRDVVGDTSDEVRNVIMNKLQANEELQRSPEGEVSGNY
jgi:hypothetical protein